ncbi:Uncharacterised protein [uncultured archaeon]|nr:Uncharacterised protein [uncultured archaeon]
MNSASGAISLVFILSMLPVFGLAGNLAVSSANYDPAPAIPGRSMDFTVHIYNNSNYDAKDVIAELGLRQSDAYSDFPFSPDSEGGTVKQLGNLPAYQSATAKFRILVDPQALDGQYTISIKAGEDGKASLSVPFTVRILSRKPIISLESSSPDSAAIGKMVTLAVSIRNTGSSSAEGISIGIGEDRTVTTTGAVVERSVVPLGAASIQIQSLSPGRDANVELPAIINPGTEPKAYFIPIVIEFYDENKVKYTQTEYAGLKVSSEAELRASVSGIVPAFSQGEKSRAIINVFNSGTGKARLASARVSSDFAGMGPQDYYIGSLSPDESYSFETEASVPEGTAPGKHEFMLQIDYKDAFGESRTVERTIEVDVLPAASAKGSDPWPAYVVLAAGIGAAFAWFIAANRKKQAHPGN